MLSIVTRRPPAPPSETSKLNHFSASGLRNGVHLVGGPGSGKSRLLGRCFAWAMLDRCEPQVIIDPIGAVVDNLFDKVNRQPLADQKRLWKNIVYLATGNPDYTFPTPLYYRLSAHDTPFEMANRLPSILQRQDPYLATAPILGWNALYECAIHAGMIAAVLGRQLDFVADLVQRPGQYKEALKQALTADATLAPAVQYFREMMDPDRHALREKQTGSFRTKLIPFLADERFLAPFCASGNGLDWAALIATGKTVVIDLRDERNDEHKQFKMLWYFKLFTDYIKCRGTAGRAQVVTLIIDEITKMLGHKSLDGKALLAADMNELIAVLGRNLGVNVVIAHQNLSQVEQDMQSVLMQLGTQIIGRIGTFEDARTIAQDLFAYDPKLVKELIQRWQQAGYAIVDRVVYHSVEEQVRMVADAIKDLPKFEFFVRLAKEEGMITSAVRRISLATEDAGHYPDPAQIAIIRDCLRKKCGMPIHQLIEEINQRRAPIQGEPKPKKKESNTQTKALPPDGRIGETAHAQAATKHNLSNPRGTADPAPSIATDIWNPVEKTPGE